MGIFDVDDWGAFGSSVANKFIPKPDVQNFAKGLPIAAQGMLDSLKSGVTYPGDVYSGKEAAPIPSQNPDLSRAADLAGLMPTGGLLSRAAGQIPQGAIGTFAGPHAANAPIKNYMKGSKLERKGASPDDIWHEAGVFRDPDKNWAHEISNQNDAFKPGVGRYLNQPSSGRLADLYDAPGLFAAYPKMKDMMLDVKPGTGGAEGRFGNIPGVQFDPRIASIEVSGPGRTLRGSLNHELNHATDLAEQRFGTHQPGYKGSAAHKTPMDYFNSAEERMARAAENRMDYTDARRQAIHPLKTPEEPHIANYIARDAARKAGDQELFEKLMNEAKIRGWNTTFKQGNREVGIF